MSTKFLHLTTRSTPESATVRQLSKFVQTVDEETLCLAILNFFLSDPKLYALPVINKMNIPVGLIDRQFFVEYFSKLYVPEVYGKRTAAQFLSENLAKFPETAPIIVDESTFIDDAAKMIVSAGMQHMVTGIIVTRDGKYLGLASGHDLLNEITLRKQSDLYFLAHFDHLTGLPNRMLFGDRLMQACRDSIRNETLVGLMFIDVDRFKQVNDSLGHGVGDILLCTIAARLKSCARDSDTVARLGGDEFAILTDNLKDPAYPELVAQRIVYSMQEPVLVSGHLLSATVSIGIALYPTDDADVSVLLTKADTAMYEAKSNGRNGFCSYVPGLLMYNSEKMSLESELKNAVKNNEFILHYQPKISLHDGLVIGVEALIRWQHPTRGLLSPIHFIPLAEENGVIIDIGNWVFREACTQHRRWSDSAMPAMQMSINVSSLQFRKPGFVDSIKSILVETGVNPNHIEIELTESTLMINVNGILEKLNALKEIGLHLSIDDFGTGYSNLNYLKQFPIDSLKIDQSFIRNIHTTPVNESIVRAIVALAKSLSMKSVAEGTENDSELAVVKNCLCDVAQGYHYAKPLTPHELIHWLSTFQNSPSPVTNQLVLS